MSLERGGVTVFDVCRGRLSTEFGSIYLSEISAAGLAAQSIPPQITSRRGSRTEPMPDWVWIVLGVIAYVFLTQWLLPEPGIPT